MGKQVSQSDRTPTRPAIAREIDPSTNALNLFVDSAINSTTVNYLNAEQYFPAVVVSVQELKGFNSEDIKHAGMPYRVPGINIKIRFSSSNFPVPALPKNMPSNPAKEGAHCFQLGQYPEADSEFEDMSPPTIGSDVWVRPESSINPRNRLLWRSAIVENAPAVKIFPASAISAFENKAPIPPGAAQARSAPGAPQSGQIPLPNLEMIRNDIIELEVSKGNVELGIPGHVSVYGNFKSYIMGQGDEFSVRFDKASEILISKTPIKFMTHKVIQKSGKTLSIRPAGTRVQRGGSAQFATIRYGREDGKRVPRNQHKGEDVYVSPRSIIYAPFKCKVFGKVMPAYGRSANYADGGYVVMVRGLEKYTYFSGGKKRSSYLTLRFGHLKADPSRDITLANGKGGQNGDGIYKEGEIIGVSYYADPNRKNNAYKRSVSTKPREKYGTFYEGGLFEAYIDHNRFPEGDPSHVHFEANIYGWHKGPKETGGKIGGFFGDINPYTAFDVSRIYQVRHPGVV